MINERKHTARAITCPAFGFHTARIQTFFHGTFRAAFPAFFDRIMTAEFWTLDKCTADFTIITFAFRRAGAWGPPLAMLV